MQGRAGYISKAVLDELKNLDQERALKVQGLIGSLVHFDYFSKIDLGEHKTDNSVLAVAFNILTRGAPTIVSPFLEAVLARATNLLIDKSSEFETSFALDDNFSLDNLIRVLHPIDSRKKDRKKSLNLDALDSKFEEAFLLNYIPASAQFLALILDCQRARNTLGADANNQGRIDFSLQIPYDVNEKRLNRFHTEVDVKHQKKYIVEVDGARYHDDKIDALKDFEVAELSNNAHHIRENSVHQDSSDFLNRILSENYLKILKKNYESNLEELVDYYALILTPIGIARIQYVILKYLISRERKDELHKDINIAVVERDLPCAKLAVEDVTMLLEHLNGSVRSPYGLGKIKLTTFSTEEFRNSPLHGDTLPKLIEKCKVEDYDLIIDITLLSKFFTVKHEPFRESDNLIIIGNSHYVDTANRHGIMVADPIHYKDICKLKTNEEYEEVTDQVKNFEYFIQLFFRKKKFRPGQLPILNRAINRKSVIGLLPTGGGKSLTYQLASLLQPGVTIVIDPIRSLMLDQYQSLTKVGVDRAAFINSTVTSAVKRFHQKQLASGELQFVFVSPERYVIQAFRNCLKVANENRIFFAYVIIDEVHCVSEWGHSFRTDYLKLGKNIVELTKAKNENSIPIFGLTATASYDVLSDIERELNIPEDDGDAIVRFENTVRDEVNYRIIETSILGHFDLEERAPNAYTIKEKIGQEKQKQTANWINGLKDNLLSFGESIVPMLEKSYTDYLPQNLKTDKTDYVKKQRKRLELQEKDFLIETKELTIGGTTEKVQKFNAATVVFCPHRDGAIGVKDVQTYLKAELGNEVIGSFMGSSDGEDAQKNDDESFKNQEAFIENHNSVMVATKAFGMGIDKGNVRSTVHINLPGSIESFVQETGRAGRDKKLSLSTILFNRESFGLYDDSNFCLDRDVLDFFHANSFKGAIKEKQIIYELRNSISYPSASNLQLLQLHLAEAFSDVNVKLNVSGSTLWLNEPDEGILLASINLENRSVRIPNNWASVNPSELTDFVLNRFSAYGINNPTQWLSSFPDSIPSSPGVENLLKNAEVGEEFTLNVAFTNRYYSKPRREDIPFLINANHLKAFLEVNTVQELISKGRLDINSVENVITKAVQYGNSFEKFVDTLSNNNEELKVQLKHQEVERAYYLPRDKPDTAKAIYRLSSLGIIDDYVIDYQNKFYYITFAKKLPGQYFYNLSELLARYSSKVTAERDVERLRERFDEDIKQGKTTEISVCVTYLTDFIYGQIADKRAQAIDDMISLCTTALSKTDPIEQNAEIKDYIYYYFNAKYSRIDYKALIEIDNERVYEPASFHVDKGLDIGVLIEKYIDLPEHDRSAAFKTNIKHLRGACMRLLRELPDHAGFKILKAYSLIILSENTPELLIEAEKELLDGLVKWGQNDKDNEIFKKYDFIEKKILNHIGNPSVRKLLAEVKSTFEIKYYATWASTFTNQFTKELTYAK